MRLVLTMRSNIAVGVFLLVLAAYVFVAGGMLPFGTIRVPQTGFFPKILAGLLAILSALLLLRARFAGQTDAATTAIGAEGWRRIGVILAALTGFALVLERLGFLLVAFLLMVVLLRAIEAQSWLKIVVIALAAALISHAVFARLLGVPLPTGVLGI